MGREGEGRGLLIRGGEVKGGEREGRGREGRGKGGGGRGGKRDGVCSSSSCKNSLKYALPTETVLLSLKKVLVIGYHRGPSYKCPSSDLSP